MYRKILILILTVVAVGTLSGYSLNNFHYGYRLNTFDATASSMGNTGSAGSSNPMGIALNANNSFYQNSNFSFETTLNANKVEDKRSFPMYNSFNLYINESTYTAQENIFYNIGLAVTSMYELNKNNQFAFGLYMIPRYSFTGNYNEEVRNNDNSNDDNYPAKIAVNDIENEGALYAYGGSLAYKYNFDQYKYLKSLALGLNLELLSGSADSDTYIRFTDWAHTQAGYGSLTDYEEKYKRDLSGFASRININYELDHRTRVSFSMTPKTNIEVDASNSFASYKTFSDSTVFQAYMLTGADSLKQVNLLNDYDLPSTYRFAVQFKPRNILKTTFNIEAELVRWSETNKIFQDKYNYYLGIEHKIIETIPVRMGFSSTHSYDICYDEDFTYAIEMMTPTVSLGTGFDITKSLRADLGVNYSFRTYETLDLFMDEYYNNTALWPNTYIDIQNRDWSNPDTVKENIFDLMFSLTLDI